MSTTLSYGFKQPQSGDPSSSWFADINTNNTLLNAHTHDGSNSSLILGSSVTASSVNTSTWSAVSTGIYSQIMTYPTGYGATSNYIVFSSTEQAYPRIVNLSATQFTIYGITGAETFSIYFK
jgi:hypothetical protein